MILPDGRRLSYQSLASEAAKTEPVTEVALRDPATWQLIGTPVQRIDIVAKSTGTQDYGIDEVQPDMLHAAIRLNPAQGAALNGYDATEAEAMRGVERIVELPGGVGVIADNTWRAMQAAQAITCDWAPAPYPAGHGRPLAGAGRQLHPRGTATANCATKAMSRRRWPTPQMSRPNIARPTSPTRRWSH